jgi:hypothetical protein
MLIGGAWRPAAPGRAEEATSPPEAEITPRWWRPHTRILRSKQMTFDAAPRYLSADDCRLADLIDLVSQKTDLADYPYAHAVEQNALLYDGAGLRTELSRPAGRRRVEAELARALSDGPGIVVLARAFDDPWVIDRATWQFEAIIAAQRAAGGYPFPANLDLDQPASGLPPPTQADILTQAVAQGWSRQQLETELGAWTARRQSRKPT